LAENQKWKQESEKFITQLSQILDRQFQEWGLSDAEKEVAHLLLKGYSVKVIAEKRFVVEKTIRTQLSSIYSKSGLASRTEFVSFFLPLFFS
jgi:DNA-binding NarL/FixJ family response regulator